MSEAQRGGRTVNRGELATLCGVSLPTVDAWLRDGCPIIKHGSRGIESEFNSAAVIEWRIARAVEAATDGLLEEDGRTSKEEADRRRAVALAITAEVEADRVLRSVVSLHDAIGMVGDFCQVLKTGLSNACAKIAARATSMANASEIEDLCQAELNRAFVSASEELKAGWEARGITRDDLGAA